MSYRTVTVDGKDYQYVVGKTHVKIRGLQAVLKEEVGKERKAPEYCECCGEPLSALYSDYVPPKRLQIHPEDVVAYIKSMR